MDIDSILEAAKNDFENRTRQEPVKTTIRPPEIGFKARTATVQNNQPPNLVSATKSQNLPPRATPITPEQIPPKQKIIDTRQDAKRIKTELVDANKGKLAEAEKNVEDNKVSNDPAVNRASQERNIADNKVEQATQIKKIAEVKVNQAKDFAADKAKQVKNIASVAKTKIDSNGDIPKIDFNKAPKKEGFAGVAKKISQGVKNIGTNINKTTAAFNRFKDTRTGKLAIGAGALAAGGVGGTGLAVKKVSEVKK